MLSAKVRNELNQKRKEQWLKSIESRLDKTTNQSLIFQLNQEKRFIEENY